MIPEELRERISADMKRAAGMSLIDMVRFLATYTADLQLWRYPDVTTDEVRRFADAELDKARGALR